MFRPPYPFRLYPFAREKGMKNEVKEMKKV